MLTSCSKSVSPEMADRAKNLNTTGLRHFASQNYAAALKDFETAAQSNPTEPEYTNNAGMTLLKLGLPARAVHNFEKAVDTKELPLYTYNLGLAFLAQGNKRKASKAFERTVELDPAQFDALYYLGLLHREHGDLQKSRQAWTKAAILRENADVENGLGTLDMDADQPAAALSHFAKAVLLRPDHFQAIYNNGVALQKLRRYAEAEAAYRKAIRVNAENPAPYLNLGIILTEMGRKPEARKALQEFLAVAPSNLKEARQDVVRRLEGLQ